MAEQSSPVAEIFVVDDDPAVRDTLSMVLKAAGYEVICFADGAALLSVARNRTPAAILLDVHIPGKSGLDILRGAARRGLSGADLHDLRTGRHRDGGGRDQERRARLHREAVPRQRDRRPARRGDRRLCARQAENASPKFGSLHFPGREPLTRREREVLEQFAAGASNKEAGRTLGISPRTIEDHRANIMKKLGARNAADLIRIVMTAAQRAS